MQLNPEIENQAVGLKEMLDRSGINTALLMPVSFLDLSNRSTESLEKARAQVLADILYWDEEEIFKIHEFGRRSWREIIERLEELGLKERIDPESFRSILASILPKEVVRQVEALAGADEDCVKKFIQVLGSHLKSAFEKKQKTKPKDSLGPLGEKDLAKSVFGECEFHLDK